MDLYLRLATVAGDPCIVMGCGFIARRPKEES